MSRLRQAVITLPTPAAFEREVRERLDLDPGETAAPVWTEMLRVKLPQAVLDDLLAWARASGWTVGELAGYLIVQGAMRVIEQGTPLDG